MKDSDGFTPSGEKKHVVVSNILRRKPIITTATTKMDLLGDRKE